MIRFDLDMDGSMEPSEYGQWVRYEDAQPEQESVAYAGVKVWIGNQQIVKHLTQTELHYAVEPWLLVELSALKCIASLKEKNT